MRQVLLFAVFMLATAVWTMAQQSGANGGQSTSPSSQTPSAGGQGQSSASGSADQGSATPTQGSSQGQGSAQSGTASQSQSSQTPSAGGQGQSSTTPGSAGQGSAQTPGQSSAQSGAATPGDAPSGTVTEGCLGGSNPNFTITDKAGATYKLNFPQNTDVSVLNSHVGESVQVLGQPASGATAGKSSAIDVSRIGRGTGNCQTGSAKPPKQ